METADTTRDANSYYLYSFRHSDPNLRLRHRPAHLGYVRTLVARGAIVMAGPLEGGNGGAILFCGQNRSDVERWVFADPYTKFGVASNPCLLEWKLVFND